MFYKKTCPFFIVNLRLYEKSYIFVLPILWGNYTYMPYNVNNRRINYIINL